MPKNYYNTPTDHLPFHFPKKPLFLIKFTQKYTVQNFGTKK